MCGDPGQPARLEREGVHPGEEHPQRRVDGDREHGGDRHGQVLRERERLEEAPLLVDEREDRQEGDGDDQQREEDRRTDLGQRREPHGVEVALAAAGLPVVELVVGVLDLDDGPVDEHADRDRDAGERHDVHGEAEVVHRDEGEEHRDRDRDDRHDRARDVPEEDEDDERDDDHLDRQLVLERVDRPRDQVGAVVGRDDLDAAGQRRLQLLEAGLDAPDHVERVLAVAHHDDAADGVAGAVEVGDPAPQLRADLDARHVAQQHRHAAGGGLDDDRAEILDGAAVAAPADHVLGAGEFQQPPADLVVRVAHRRDDRFERDLVGGEADGVDRHLVLPHEPADGGHLGDAGHRLHGVAQRPVLQRAQRVEPVRAGAVDQRVLEDPADAGGVRAELGADAFGEPRLDLREVLEHPGAGPVDVGAVLEDDVDVGEPEIREPADGLDLRGAEQRRDDGVGHLVLDDVGRAVPLREDDDLGVGEVGERVEADGLEQRDRERDQHEREDDDEPGVFARRRR